MSTVTYIGSEDALLSKQFIIIIALLCSKHTGFIRVVNAIPQTSKQYSRCEDKEMHDVN